VVVRAGGWLAAVACLLLGCGWTAARAADLETRDFTVFVDGKRRGDAHMTIHRQDDGTTQMTCDTDVVVPILFTRYVYSYRGREVWKDGRVQRFDSRCDDNGRAYQISAAAEEGGLRVRVNGQDKVVPAHVWLTSYWTLPDPKLRNQVVPLLDADTGKDLECRIQDVGAVQIPVAGRLQNVRRYRLTGRVQVDVWYDDAERLVRQEWIEDGHRTALELVRVRR
jgi:hypothetical protein